MNIISKDLIIKSVLKIIVIVAVAKIATLSLVWFLPTNSINYSKKVSFLPKFQRYSAKTMIDVKKEAELTQEQKEAQAAAAASVVNTPISDMILTGVYKTQSGGFIIISLKNDKESSIISMGEIFNGYKLIELEPQRAIFEKGGKRFVVEMLNSDTKLPEVKKVDDENKTDESEKTVSKKDIDHYAKNFDEIWKDISINEVKENGQITGFKVTKIREKSAFANLGLKKDDVIIRANNTELKSYADALNIYKNIKEIDTLVLTVLRNNQEVEIVYEVN